MHKLSYVAQLAKTDNQRCRKPVNNLLTELVLKEPLIIQVLWEEIILLLSHETNEKIARDPRSAR